MKSILWRSVLISIAFMVAHAILNPFGLGWLVILVFLVFMTISITRLLKNQHATRPADSREEDRDGENPESGNLLQLLRARLDHLVQTGNLDDDPDATKSPKAKPQDTDCALTHQERVEFDRMIQRMGDAE